MPYFKIHDNKLKPIKEVQFKLEKDIQKLTEANIEEIFGYELISSEFTIDNFRLDTVAFNKETKSFIIIEYKNNKNYSVVDQGYAYLSKMFNNKADFVLEYNEKHKEPLRKSDIDWSQSKVLFISPFFTTYQKEAINNRGLPIELQEITRYNNDTINYSKIQTSSSDNTITNLIQKNNKDVDIVSREIKVYTEEYHLEKGSDTTKELYETFKDAILNLDEFEIVPRKNYIAFVKSRNIIEISIQRKQLLLFINLSKGQLKDPLKLCRDVSDVGKHGNGDYEIKVKDDEHLDYIMSLVKQALKVDKKQNLY